MSYLNGIFIAPVGLAEVKRKLGVMYEDTGTCCTSANVNKWAKYKPVVNSQREYDNQLNADKTWKSTADWWKGSQGNCGILLHARTHTASGVNGLQQVCSDAETEISIDSCYEHVRPSGTDHHRLTDFISYKHEVSHPIQSAVITYTYNRTQRTEEGIIIPVGFVLHINDIQKYNDVYALSLNDLKWENSPLNNWYLGIVWKKNGYYYIETDNKTIGNTDKPAFPIYLGSNLGAGSHTFYPVITNTTTNRTILNEAQFSGLLLPIPVVTAQTINLIIPKIANLDMLRNNGTTTVAPTVRCTLTSNVSTATNIYFTIRVGSTNGDAKMTLYDTYEAYAEIPSGKKAGDEFTLTIIPKGQGISFPSKSSVVTQNEPYCRVNVALADASKTDFVFTQTYYDI